VTAQYLLPCDCGRQIVVEPRQAGQAIPCSCGELLPVPTLLDMAKLEPAPTESASKSSPKTWGLKQNLRFLGIVFLVAALVGGGCHYILKRPVSQFDVIEPEEIRQSAQRLPPAEAWDVWERMKQGLDHRVDQKFADEMRTFQLWQGFFALVATTGVALIVVSAIKFKK
jgi:hypothetical protein